MGELVDMTCFRYSNPTYENRIREVLGSPVNVVFEQDMKVRSASIRI
jgi:hypothetical protein